MSKLKLSIAVSLDGFVAGPDPSVENPLGVGGEQLHEWAFSLEAFRRPHGMEGGEVTASTTVLEQVRVVEAPGVTHLKYRAVRGEDAGVPERSS